MSTAQATVNPADATPSARGRRGVHIALGFVFALISAVMLYVMWDGHGNLWPLVFIGFVPMFIAQYRLLPRKLAPLAVGIALFGYWLSFAEDGGGVLSIGELVGLSLLLALMWTVFVIFERRFAERTNYKWFIAQFALLWTVFELVAQYQLVAGSNFWIEYRTASAPWMFQPVSWFSTPAWGLVFIMFNAAIALLIMKAMDKRWPYLADVPLPARTVKWSSIIAFGTMILWLLTSLWINTQVNDSLGAIVRVAAVQTGIQNTTSSGLAGEGGQQGTPADIARNARLQAQLTEMTRSAAQQGAQLVVWPEEELDYDLQIPAKSAWIGALAKETQTTIVTGFMPDSPNLTSPNLAAVFFPNGQMAPDVYAKEHPVILEGEAFKRGTAPAVYTTSFGKLGVIICFDHDFPDGVARTSVLAGANIMAVPAIDPASIANLRWQSLTFRAVENRVPYVKTDVGFDSAIINANGQLVDRVATSDPAGSTNLLVGNVNIGPRDSQFTKMGSYPLTAVLLLLLAMRIGRQVYLSRRKAVAATSEPE